MILTLTLKRLVLALLKVLSHDFSNKELRLMNSEGSAAWHPRDNGILPVHFGLFQHFMKLPWELFRHDVWNAGKDCLVTAELIGRRRRSHDVTNAKEVCFVTICVGKVCGFVNFLKLCALTFDRFAGCRRLQVPDED